MRRCAISAWPCSTTRDMHAKPLLTPVWRSCRATKPSCACSGRAAAAPREGAMSNELFRLSHTKIVSFNRCRKQYWFRYVSGLEWPAERDTPAAMMGTGVHRAMKVLCETGDPTDGEHELDAYVRMPKHEAIGPGTAEHRLAVQLYANGVA